MGRRVHHTNTACEKGFNDVLSQLTGNAFRSQDWWYFPQRGMYHQKSTLQLMRDKRQVKSTLTHFGI